MRVADHCWNIGSFTELDTLGPAEAQQGRIPILRAPMLVARWCAFSVSIRRSTLAQNPNDYWTYCQSALRFRGRLFVGSWSKWAAARITRVARGCSALRRGSRLSF